jgi:hypothetical protein
MMRSKRAAPVPKKQEHVVLLIHGIRTHAQWVGMVKATLEHESDLSVEPIPYGSFSLYRFLLPGPTRCGPANIVGKYINDVRERGENLLKSVNERRLISVIAHSFGTYCLFRVLEQQPNISLHRVILCGSVLPQHIDLARYKGQLGSNKLLNECGDRDPWPVLAKAGTWGYRSSGTFGLFGERVVNRFHRYAHSDCFDAEFVNSMWKPFLEHGEVTPSKWDVLRSRHPNPWWISFFGWFPLKSTVLMMVLLALSFLPRSSALVDDQPQDSVRLILAATCEIGYRLPWCSGAHVSSTGDALDLFLEIRNDSSGSKKWPSS